MLAGKRYKFVLNPKSSYKNSYFRLGIYTTACDKGLTKNKDGSACIWKGALVGGFGGFVGQALASPFFMVIINFFFVLHS